LSGIFLTDGIEKFSEPEGATEKKRAVNHLEIGQRYSITFHGNETGQKTGFSSGLHVLQAGFNANRKL